MQLSFHRRELRVVVANERELVLEIELVNGIGFAGQQVFLPAVAIGGGAGQAVVCQLMGLDAGQEFGPLPDKGQPLAQERPKRALLGRIGVAWGDEVGPEEMGELLGIDAVVLVFAAVDGLEVEGMGQDEVNAGLIAGIGEPVSAEHTFANDGEVVAVRSDEFEEEVEIVVADVGVDEFFAGTIHEADVHLAGMEIDSAVEFSGGVVVFHG